MSSSVRSLPGARGLPVRALIRPGNLLPALVWALILYTQVINSPFPPPLPNALLVMITSGALVLFIIRRDPTTTGSAWEMAVALLGTFIVAFLPGPQVPDTNWLATSIQVVGLVGWAAALVSLGRSLGIAPADRGLVQHGLYRFVRHPMYASEMIFFLGFFIAVPTWRSAVMILAWIALQIIRLLREERILAGYPDYRARVRWRLFPGVW